MHNKGPIKVEIRGEPGHFQLFRGGEPYNIKGAGIESGELQAFADHGGNSFRTWSVGSKNRSGKELLDEAQRLGLTVALGLPMGKEVWGFDYDDADAVAAQLAEVTAIVAQYKDHPALLCWVIGNELNFDYKNPRVYTAVNDISRMIHRLDPNHPTTTTTAGISATLLADIVARAPDLDFLSVQVYGELYNLPDAVQALQIPMPLMITEWGAVGHWEIESTRWGAPLEDNSSVKAANYLRGYSQVLAPLAGHVVGNYVFFWGQKQEKTPTWYGMFLQSGEETEAIDVMHYIWNNRWPDNRSPSLQDLQLDGAQAQENVTLVAGRQYAAQVFVAAADNHNLTFEWVIMREATATPGGGSYEPTPEILADRVEQSGLPRTTVTAPVDPGPYRLFVYVRDQRGHGAHANIPFLVVAGTGRVTTD